MAKVKSRGTATRLTRTDRIARRLKTVEPTSAFKVKGAVFAIRIFAVTPEEIQGYILAQDEHSVTMRHKRTSASKRMVISRFPYNSILESFGSVGEISSVTVMRETIVREYSGSVVAESQNLLTIKTVDGETVNINKLAARVELVADDEEGKPAKGKKKARAEKEVKADKPRRKKRKSDDDDLDD